MLKSLIAKAKDAASEFQQFEQLMAPENQALRRLVFYSESGIYYRYYEDYIDYILANSDLDVCYVTSERTDPIFELNNPRIRPFFIKNLLPTMLSKLDSKVLVMATPDLHNGFMKRAPDTVHHVYAFRGISSTHQSFRLGAFDHYDSILCVAQYQIDEIRKTEEIYGLPPKQLVLTGCPISERIYREHQDYLAAQPKKSDRPIVLIAPSWAPILPESSILDNCILPLIDALAGSQFDVWIRPHPEYKKRFPEKMEKIAGVLKKHPKYANLRVQSELSSMQCLHEADILITDHSAIGVDYFIGTERPIVYIDTPLRVDNPEWERLGIKPVENGIRAQLGGCIKPENVGSIVPLLTELISKPDEFKRRVPEIRNLLVANWQRSAEIGGAHILKLCQAG